MTALTDATFYAPLKTTLVPTNGSGNPTFTRTSTKTVEDNEGNVVTLKSGAVGLAGARVVQNWFVDTTTLSASANWAVSNTSKSAATDPDGGSTAVLVTVTADSSNHFRQSYTSATLGGDTRTYKILYYPGTATWIRVLLYAGSTDRVSVWFNATTNVIGTVSIGGTGWAHISSSLTASVDYPGWYELYIIATTPQTGTHYLHIGLVDADNSILTTAVNGKTITYAFPQLENTTGQSDQTPGEYVPTGLSTPYHGGGADGVKYFDTDSSAAAIPDATMSGAQLDYASKTNSMLSCRRLTASAVASTCPWKSSVTGGVEKVVNGTFNSDVSSWTAGPGVGASITWNPSGQMDAATGTGSNILAYQTITGLTIGKTYTLTCDRVASSNNFGIYLSVSGALMQSGFTSTAATRELTFNASATSHRIDLVTGTASMTATVDNISLKESDVQVTNNQTGVDGLANSCSLLTAAAADVTILQTITAAATAACTGFKVKRSVGTGSIYITRDGGSNWTDITSLINSSTFTLVGIENTSVTNPQVGFKIATSGDAIIVDSGRNHSGTELCEDIFTTTAAITRAEESLTYQTSGNFSDTAGTILATVKRDNWANGNGSVVGKASFGLLTSASNSGVQAADGTNTVSGAAGTPTGQRRIGARWSGTSLQAFGWVAGTGASVSNGTAGSYDGSFNLSTVAVMPGTQGYIRDLAIFNSSLSAESVSSAWGAITSVSVTGIYGTVGVGSVTCSLGTSFALTGVYGNAYVTSGTPSITAAASVAPTATEMYSHLGSVEVTEYWPDLSGGGGGGTGKFTRGTCDRCGFVYKLNALKVLVINQSPSGLMVCTECWEEDHPQNRIGSLRLKESNPTRNPRPDTPSGDD